jgi:hypothetical protein
MRPSNLERRFDNYGAKNLKINDSILRVAEREGFEPPIRLPVCRISSAVLSTTQPPLQVADIIYIPLASINAPNAIATEIATESSSFGL